MVTSSATPSSPFPFSPEGLLSQLTACRQQTLELAHSLSADEYCRQAHPDFSPAGWHLGHMAAVESHWILERLAGEPGPAPEYRRLFAADGLPKHQRQQLPPLETVLGQLRRVRQGVEHYLQQERQPQPRLWAWLLQHEAQHAETVRIVLALHRHGEPRIEPGAAAPPAEMAYISEATLTLGCDGVEALDNEQPPQQIHVPGFWLDVAPVTQAQFRAFMAAGGYGEPRWWSAAGWAWQRQQRLTAPRYWRRGGGSLPVCGVSYYEAEAYASFAGKRLPTEAEWERAAAGAVAGNHWIGLASGGLQAAGAASGLGLRGMVGHVWEWTSSWFAGYPGFQPFPYRGYSAAYFDHDHRVLRGGSWATAPWGLRPTLRNWYQPTVRQIFSGIRCAR